MYLVFRFSLTIRRFVAYSGFFAIIYSIGCLEASAQNVTSPYSILGIGDIDTKQPGRYFISGNTALARRDIWAYNSSNPASLTALPFKTIHFDAFMQGKVSTFSVPEDDTATSPSRDFVMRRISMAFKVNNKTGFAFGLQPYSGVNYKLHEVKTVPDGTSSYDKEIDGSGGINQVYFSLGTSLGKKLSVGVTASYLFGSLNRSTRYYNSFMDMTKQEYDFYWGGLFTGGIQYYSLPGKKWQQRLGAVVSVSTNLHGQLTTEYTDNGTSINKTIEDDRFFNLPVSAGIGYSATNTNGLTLSVEGNYYNWKYQEVNYTNSYTYPSLRASAGLEYSFSKKEIPGLETAFVGMGITAQNSYIRVRGDKLWDMSVSLGGGMNLTRSLAFYTGLDIGKKGDKKSGKIQENYTQFVFGITLKDIWLGPKFKKYD